MAATTPAAAATIKQNVLRLGDAAPNFTAETSEGTIEWHKYIDGKWAILFSHPKNYTPVCTTELGRVSQLKEEWTKRGVVVAGLSVDKLGDHKGWIADINELSNSKMDYPLIADADKAISVLYGMLDPTHLNAAGLPFTIRSVFIIGPDKLVKLILSYPASTGRNFDEVIRCIDSLQLTATKKVATPVDWKKGGDCVILPSVTNEQAALMFPSIKTVKPYIRFVSDPSATAAATAAPAAAK
jgi:alkyl hydroperoxide reductase subunit AhpC